MQGVGVVEKQLEEGKNILEIQVLYHPPMKEVKAHKEHRIIDITLDGWVKHKERAST